MSSGEAGERAGGQRGAYRYRAFISYSRKDRREAQDLQRALEGYVLPAALRAMSAGLRMDARPIKPVFRDEDELVPGQDLPDRIRKGLEASEFLIVVCSPHAAQSAWVEKEICDFVRLGRRQNILAVVVGGLPHSGDSATEALPRALRFKVSDDGVISDQAAEPLWIDWRTGTPRSDRAMFLRIVAALLSLTSLDELIQRDQQQQRRRRLVRWGMAAGLVIPLIASALLLASNERARLSRQAALLTGLAGEANRSGQYETAARYAIAAVHGANHPVFGFDSGTAQAELSHALPQIKRLAFPELLTGLPEISDLAVAPGGTRVAAGSGERVHVWNMQTGARVCSSMFDEEGYGSPVSHLAFSPDGAILVSAAGDQAQMLDAATCGALGAPLSHRGAIKSVNFSPDGTLLLTTADDGTARLWRVPEAGAHGAPLVHKTTYTAGLAGFTPDGQFAVTAGLIFETNFYIWDAVQAEPARAPVPLATLASGRKWQISGLALRGDGARLLLWSESHFEIHAMPSGALAALSEFDVTDRGILAAGFAPGTDDIWIADYFGAISFLTPGSNTASRVVYPGEAARFDLDYPRDGVETALDGTFIVIAGSGTGLVFDAQNGMRLGGPLRHATPIINEKISPDGLYIATASALGVNAPATLRVWHARPQTDNTGPNACTLLGQLKLPVLTAAELRAVPGLSVEGDFNGVADVCAMRSAIDRFLHALLE